MTKHPHDRSFKILLYLVVAVAILVYTNKEHLFWDEEERAIIEVMPRDSGIPAIYEVDYVLKDEYYLDNSSLIIGVFQNDIAKAYPIMILDRHEIINDVIGNTSIAVTYCPLTDSPLVYSTDEYSEFGVSGNLFKNNLVMYDRETDSMWSQLYLRSIKGELKNQRLDFFSSTYIDWGTWRTLYPETKLVALPQHFTVDEYFTESYLEYRASNSAGLFPLDHQNFTLESKERVLGIKIGNFTKAYRYSVLESEKILNDEINGQRIVITYFQGSAQAFHADSLTFSHKSGIIMIDEEDGEWNMLTGENTVKGKLSPVVSISVYWFAWYDFYPETKVK